MKVAALVLAAGSSSRMGRNKLLLDLGGETVVRRAVRAAVESGVQRVVVVLGHDEPQVRTQLGGLSCTAIVNPDHAEGVGTSLHAGVRHVMEDADAVVVVLADMPFVTAEMIRALVERQGETRAPVVVSRYGDVQAPPTLFDRSLFAELLATPGERCAKQVVGRHVQEAAAVFWPAAVVRDIDVPGDYESIVADLRRR